VVLAHEDERQAPERADIESFGQHALVGGAITKEADRNASLAVQLTCECRADGKPDPARDDAVRAHDPATEVGDVHRAAHAAANARRAAINLGDKIPGTAALCDEMSVAAMGACDPVGVGEMRADADSHGLLPDVKVNRTRQLARAPILTETLLDLS